MEVTYDEPRGSTRIVEYRDEFSHDESPSFYERYAYNVAVCFSQDEIGRAHV